MNILQTRSLTKRYGSITAVDDLNLAIKKGSVFGLLGPNGSGKSTTLGMILDVVVPTSGDFNWFEAAPSHQHRKRIGAILEKPNFYPSISATKNLELVCKIKGVDEGRIPEVIDQVGLTNRRNSAFKTYSLGMKQRLAIASALLARPEVLIFDEPTNGLDPEGISDIRNLIVSIAEGGKTIILASHLLDEVQKVCSEFGILKSGKLIHTGNVLADFGEGVVIEVVTEDLPATASVLKEFSGLKNVKLTEDHLELTCTESTVPSEINKFLAERGIYTSRLIQVKKNLEQQFIEITKGDV